jgi:glycosyltransferase involved in cell wall biosynthesis
MMPSIAHSSERRDSIAAQLGAAHYSYVFVELAIVRLLNRAGYKTNYVQEPQIYKHEKAYRKLLGCRAEDVIHIAFRSTENIRVMAGAKNISVFFWEFEVMRDWGLITDSVLVNQVHMLSLMDEIWVGSEFTRLVLEKYGLHNTYVVPPPIIDDRLPDRLSFAQALNSVGHVITAPLLLVGGMPRKVNADAITPFLAPLFNFLAISDRTGRAEGRIFLTILNPGDLRKNMLNIIEGFQIAANSSKASDILIIKLISPKMSGVHGTLLYDNMIPLCNGALTNFDKNVIFIFDYLSESQMSALFCLADYYLCAPHCEGLNMPLLQAMSFGTVPVTTRNTAMIDYINDENAIVVAERRFTSPITGMAGDVAGVPYFLNFASRFDIARACTRAITQTDESYARMSNAVKQVITEHFGEKTILRLIGSRLSKLFPTEGGS